MSKSNCSICYERIEIPDGFDKDQKHYCSKHSSSDEMCWELDCDVPYPHTYRAHYSIRHMTATGSDYSY